MHAQWPKRLLCALSVAAALGAANGAALAQTAGTLEQSATEIDRTASKAPSRAATNMAKEFSGVVGSEAEALKLVEGLRKGTAVTLEDSQTTVTPSKGSGYGNVFISLALTQATLSQSGNTAPTSTQFSAALNEVLAKRASGMGWGRIAKEMDLNLGKVISSVKSGNERLAASMKDKDTREKSTGKREDHAPHTGKGDRPDKAARPDKPDRPEKSMRP